MANFCCFDLVGKLDFLEESFINKTGHKFHFATQAFKGLSINPLFPIKFKRGRSFLKIKKFGFIGSWVVLMLTPQNGPSTEPV